MGQTESTPAKWPPEGFADDISNIAKLKPEEFLAIKAPFASLSPEAWDFNAHKPWGMAAAQDPKVTKLLSRLIYKRVDESEFWRIYFCHVGKIMGSPLVGACAEASVTASPTAVSSPAKVPSAAAPANANPKEQEELSLDDRLTAKPPPTPLEVVVPPPPPQLKKRQSQFGNMGNFGDLMSGTQTGMSLPDDFAPLERVVLTANGNLQRIMSSYYNSPVTVHVLKNEKVGRGVFDREVYLECMDIRFCTATSTVRLTREDCIDAVENKGVAIGQMFRFMNILPTFVLRDCGHSGGGGFWRQYDLKSEGIVCEIVEEFPADLFSLQDRAQK